MDNRTYVQTEILYCRSGGLNPWTVSACAARNYGPQEWTFISNIKPFLKKSSCINVSQFWTHKLKMYLHFFPVCVFSIVMLIPKMFVDDQTDRHKVTKGSRTTRRTEILYCHSGYTNPWPASACAARNYRPREWTFIANLKPFFLTKFQYNLYLFIFKFILR